MRQQLSSVASFIACLLLLTGSAVTILATPGDLDTTFGILGQLSDTSLVNAQATAVQTDGKILAVGNKSFRAAVVRYNSDGSIDTSFGTDGRVFADTTYGIFHSVLVQADGKIVAAGRNDDNAFVMRLNSNGTFDTTFSGDGKLLVNFVANFHHSEFIKVSLEPNGDKIVLAGNLYYDAEDYPCVEGSDVALARLNSSGTFDTSFDGNGKQTLDVSCRDILTSMAIHPTSNKIAFTTEGQGDFQVGMLNVNGSWDTSFGGDGLVETDFNGTSYQHDRAASVVFQRWFTTVGGLPAFVTRLVVGGTAYGSSATVYDWGLARYKLDGTLDTTFDGDGRVRKSLSYHYESVHAMVIDSQNRIVTTGVRAWNGTNDFAVVRFTRDGAYDTTFGNGGKVYTKFYDDDGGHENSVPDGVALTPDGKIVVAGGGTVGPGGVTEVVLARYDP